MFLIRDPEHWCKEAYIGDNSSFCMLGALRAVYNRPSVPYGTPLVSVVKAIGELHPKQWGVAVDMALNGTRSTAAVDYGIRSVVSGFNDDPYTTHPDVMRVMQRAREIAAAS